MSSDNMAVPGRAVVQRKTSGAYEPCLVYDQVASHSVHDGSKSTCSMRGFTEAGGGRQRALSGQRMRS